MGVGVYRQACCIDADILFDTVENNYLADVE